MKLFHYFLIICTCLALFQSCEKGESTTASSSAINPGDRLNLVLSVDQFTWKEGLDSWKQPSEDRLWSSIFTFRANGEFIYSFDFDGVNYNLIGEYVEVSKELYSFYGIRNTNNGAGSGTQVLVEGTIRLLDSKRFRIEMEYGASNNTSAIVNRQEFFLQTHKRFCTTMTVE